MVQRLSGELLDAYNNRDWQARSRDTVTAPRDGRGDKAVRPLPLVSAAAGKRRDGSWSRVSPSDKTRTEHRDAWPTSTREDRRPDRGACSTTPASPDKEMESPRRHRNDGLVWSRSKERHHHHLLRDNVLLAGHRITASIPRARRFHDRGGAFPSWFSTAVGGLCASGAWSPSPRRCGAPGGQIPPYPASHWS